MSLCATATATLFYHVSPSARRELQLRHGLTVRPGVARRWDLEDQPDGLYLWRSAQHARWWAASMSWPADLWQVTLSPDQAQSLLADPIYERDAVVCAGPLGPGSLALLDSF